MRWPTIAACLTPPLICVSRGHLVVFMDVFAGFHGRVLAAVQQLKHDGVVPPDASIEGITLGSPKRASHGDLATNAAMVLAKPAGLGPRALAECISPLLASDPHIEK